jgi:uncharacterized protein YjcR
LWKIETAIRAGDSPPPGADRKRTLLFARSVFVCASAEPSRSENEKQTKGGARRMARDRSPERDKAREIWLESGGKMTAKQVAEAVGGVKPEQVRKWKSLDSWAAALEAKKPPRKRGGQPGNKNAAGAGPPTGNRNAETHGAYSAVRMEDLTTEQRVYIQKITLDTKKNMLAELQLLIAKEFDLQNKIAKLESAESGSLFVDRVVEVQTPKGQERLNQQLEKLASLQAEEEALRWDMDVQQGKPPTKQQQKRLESLQREIAALQDTTGDRARELEKAAYNTATRTVIQASAFDRTMKLEAELNRIHGRIIKLLDSIKGYELESRRVRLEERKYNLAKQKLSGAFDIDPETGEINDEQDDFDAELEV